MSTSVSGNRDLPASKHDLSTYWGRVKQAAEISDPRYVSEMASMDDSWRGLLFPFYLPCREIETSALSVVNVNFLYRTLFVSSAGLESAKQLLTAYKNGQIGAMTPEIWHAKKIVDSTLHPG